MSAGQSPTAVLAFPPLPELRTIQVFGRSIRYYDLGSGPPLLLIHGIGGDADEWAFCFESFSTSHRVIALDLLGFGRSDKPLISYTIEALVEVVQHFLRALKIDRVCLIGNSLGGWIAASLALKRSELVEKLILVDAAGVWGNATNFPVDLRVSSLKHLREVFRMLFYDKTLATEELVDTAYRQHLERGDGYAIESVLRNVSSGQEHLDAVIGDVEVPTLIVWGEQDELIPVSTGRLMHQRIPGSSLMVIPHCGHLPALEKPAQLVDAVLQFLA